MQIGLYKFLSYQVLFNIFHSRFLLRNAAWKAPMIFFCGWFELIFSSLSSQQPFAVVIFFATLTSSYVTLMLGSQHRSRS